MKPLRLKIKSTGLENDAGAIKYLESKIPQLERVLPKGESAVSCAVELEKTTKHHIAGKIYRAEFNVRVGKTLFRAEEIAESIEAAIDAAKDEVKVEITKAMTKRKTVARAGAREMKRRIRE